MVLSDPEHPIWNISKYLVIFAFCILFAVINCSKFDKTEIKMLIQIFVLLFGASATDMYFKLKRKKDEKDSNQIDNS
jgi:hypothetical protein